uniref:Uncharacterized protein n=1 Tax=Denticeps clupeoides TaxID=299321 RepID=A0AAY4D6H2_9TELE
MYLINSVFLAVPSLLPCAEVETQTPHVLLGSSATASCHIRENCPLTKGQEFHVKWYLNNLPILGNLSSNHSSQTYVAFIRSFTDAQGYLECHVCLEYDCQVVGGLQIRGGYPPEAPQNLSCLTNFTLPETVTCLWSPGHDTHLPTNYTFHTKRNSVEMSAYTMPSGVHSITLLRPSFYLFSKMEVYVEAVNALGQATSQSLLYVPVESAKFDPPKILQMKPNTYGCLKFSWSLSKDQEWIYLRGLNVELHLHAINSEHSAKEKVILKKLNVHKDLETCGLLHGTEHQARIRIKYKQGRWSDWSNSAVGTTLEKAPTGRLDTWLKILEEETPNYYIIDMAWKPSKQFRANGKNILYFVFMVHQDTSKSKLCITSKDHCSFYINKHVQRVYLTVKNDAGAARPKAVPVLQTRALGSVSSMSVLPYSDRALLVQWEGPASPVLTGYVLEWRQLSANSSSLVSFHLLDANQSSALVSDGIEPYKPYEILLYTKYGKEIGSPHTDLAYSKQKAPSTAPTLIFREIWHSHAELFWNEIPLEQRNGIVRSYRIFYWEEQDGKVKVIESDQKKRRVVLRDLKPQAVYRAFIMVRTDGGSINGSFVTLQAGSVGELKIWPKVPDPANSSIRKWKSDKSLQDSNKNGQEPVLQFLSHFSLVDLLEKELETASDKTENWRRYSSTEEDYLPGGSQSSYPFSEEGSNAVPYATLVFSGPYRSQSSPPVYLRSDSTQPLLQEENLQSPSQYVNVCAQRVFFSTCQDVSEEQGEGLFFEGFPLLNSVDIKDFSCET